MPLLTMDKVKRCQSALWGTRKSMGADLAFYFDARNSTNGKKKSNCWIRTHFPKHSNKGIPLIGILLNFSFPEFVKHVQNNSDQTSYNDTIGQEWEVHNLPGNYYQCLERCNHNTDWLPRPKLNCTGATYVGKYAKYSKGTFEIRY